MVKTKLSALWLFIVGTIWALAMAWLHLVMSGISEPVLPLPVHFFLGFVGPALLIFGSTLVMTEWHSRLGLILVLVACALLTWWFAPDCISFFISLFRPKPPLQAPTTTLDYIVVTILAAFIISADIVALFLLRRVAKPSNQTLQPTANRRNT